MAQPISFVTAKTGDNKTQFIGNDITITVAEYSYNNGRHEIANPRAATAWFVCCEKRYVVTNLEGVSTVEDWYLQELLPKFQMLKLLIADITP